MHGCHPLPKTTQPPLERITLVPSEQCAVRDEASCMLARQPAPPWHPHYLPCMCQSRRQPCTHHPPQQLPATSPTAQNIICCHPNTRLPAKARQNSRFCMRSPLRVVDVGVVGLNEASGRQSAGTESRLGYCPWPSRKARGARNPRRSLSAAESQSGACPGRQSSPPP